MTQYWFKFPLLMRQFLFLGMVYQKVNFYKSCSMNWQPFVKPVSNLNRIINPESLSLWCKNDITPVSSVPIPGNNPGVPGIFPREPQWISGSLIPPSSISTYVPIREFKERPARPTTMFCGTITGSMPMNCNN